MSKWRQLFADKWAVVFVALLLLIGMPIKAEAVEFTAVDVSAVLLTNDGAGLYTEPDAGTAPVFVLNAGMPMQVTGITSNNWYRIDLSGTIFYMPVEALMQPTLETSGAGAETIATPPTTPMMVPGAGVSYQVMEAYTSTVGSLEEALAELDKVSAMRVRNWTLNINGRNSNNIGMQVWNEIKQRYKQSVVNYNENTSQGVKMKGTSGQCVFTFQYPSAQQDAAVEAVVASVLPQLNQGSDYDRVKKVHDYLCNHITYTLNGGPEIYTAYGALVEGKAVCEGYAIAFQRFMEAMGIPCYIASGTIKGEGHAWNLVQLNGQWYHLDATWDDQEWGIADRYFLISGSKMGYDTWGNYRNVVTMATSDYKK